MAERLRLSAAARQRTATVRAPFNAAMDARAAELLSASRGRAPIAAAPGAGKAAASLLRPLLPNKGLGLSELKRQWREIAGEGVAKVASPDKLSGGVLTLKAPSAVAPFVQHQIPLIIERCRLAGAAINSVKIAQGAPVKAKPNVRPVKRALTPAEEKALAEAMGRIDDPGLKTALLRLGKAITRG